MNFKEIVLSQSNRIWTLRIQRPQALNALNGEVLQEISTAIEYLQQTGFAEIRGLIITGSGEKAFVAGADIKEMTSLSSSEAKVFAQNGQKVFRQIENLKLPTIAAVNGFALGGGLELALACDFIYASENAKLGLPEVGLGLIPGFGGTVRLARAIGMPRAKELIYRAEAVSALEALRLGIVNQVFPLTDLLPAAQKALEAISTKGPVALQMAKKSILQTWDLEIDQAMSAESENFSYLFTTHDFKEGTQSFVEKRRPLFQGK